MKITINEILVLQKVVRERTAELRSLRSSVANRELYMYGKDNQKVVEPQYDVKAVDRKITELERFLLKSDTAVKRSNAITEVEVDSDTDKLFDPIQ